MPSLFGNNYRTPTFIPPYTDREWDDVRLAIRNNRKDIDKELISFALSFMALNPQLASMVPFLSREIGVIPNPSVNGTISTIEDILRNIQISRITSI